MTSIPICFIWESPRGAKQWLVLLPQETREPLSRHIAFTLRSPQDDRTKVYTSSYLFHSSLLTTKQSNLASSSWSAGQGSLASSVTRRSFIVSRVLLENWRLHVWISDTWLSVIDFFLLIRKRVYTVQPLLSRHPCGMAKWLLNTGWPPNTGCKNTVSSNTISAEKTSQIMHLSMSSPRGGRSGIGWGFWHFLKKNHQNPHPRARNNWRPWCKKGVYRILADFHFLQDRANFWQTDLIWHEKHRSLIVSVNLRFVLQK